MREEKLGSFTFEHMSVETANNPKKSAMFDLRTGRPLEIPEGDLYGRCRCVSSASGIDLVMNTMN